MSASPLMFSLLFICCLCLRSVLAITNITTTQFLNDTETIVSSNAQFRMGFFSPTNSTNRYVGIWYNIKDYDPKEVVWVANRNNPINDSSGVFKISDDGNLQLLDGQDMIVWSSNVSHQVNTTSVAQLRDTGNLVLLSSSSGKIVWQSFDHLTNTLLPMTKLSIDLLTINQDFNQDNMYPFLRSWKSTSNPSDGQFTAGLLRSPITEVIVHNGDKTYWRSGSFNGTRFLGVRLFYTGFHVVYDDNEVRLDMTYSVSNDSLMQHIVLNHDGNMVVKLWDEGSRKWKHWWQSIQSDCDIYGKCGPFGSCNAKGTPICDCLHGFEPMNKEEWRVGNWTNGCVRSKQLLCGVTGPKQDMFLKLKYMKPSFNISVLPDYDEDACQRRCVDSCPCVAYAHPMGIGCMIWQSLIDLQEFSSHGADIFIRLAYSESEKTSNTKTIIVVIVSIIAAATLVVFAYCLWSLIYGQHVKKLLDNETKFVDAVVDQAELNDLPLFKFKELEVATINFSETNKLGEGGFGPVYKGKLEDGQEIAVKRLSRASGQGLQEFMDEVLVISKLQHKNLVRLLGCCVERDEKLLVYEFMPNKSLDAFLFDSHHQKQLDWKKRFNIISGIFRGLLYLHRDSRLKIIHRDLKASNILLDEELNPKISDFGMARIFATKQDQANTLRVVGTYGYMSPEYAMEGRFSEKSDVFSLGVLLLEIVSGRKNSSFLNDDSLGLLPYTWKLWNENDMLSLVDPAILDPSFESEIMKCIQLGLLSVQEFPEDRPTISDLVSMLDVNDIMELPHPTQPGFIQRKAYSSDEVLQNHQEHGSVNYVSLTAVSGR